MCSGSCGLGTQSLTRLPRVLHRVGVYFARYKLCALTHHPPLSHPPLMACKQVALAFEAMAVLQQKKLCYTLACWSSTCTYKMY
jgi:hypothetical protein